MSSSPAVAEPMYCSDSVPRRALSRTASASSASSADNDGSNPFSGRPSSRRARRRASRRARSRSTSTPGSPTVDGDGEHKAGLPSGAGMVWTQSPPGATHAVAAPASSGDPGYDTPLTLSAPTDGGVGGGAAGSGSLQARLEELEHQLRALTLAAAETPGRPPVAPAAPGQGRGSRHSTPPHSRLGSPHLPDPTPLRGRAPRRPVDLGSLGRQSPRPTGRGGVADGRWGAAAGTRGGGGGGAGGAGGAVAGRGRPQSDRRSTGRQSTASPSPRRGNRRRRTSSAPAAEPPTTERGARPGWGLLRVVWELAGFLKQEISWGTMRHPSPSPEDGHVFNFVHVPIALEKFLILGFLACLEAFLHIIIYLPIRMVIALVLMGVHLIQPRRKLFHRSQLYDILRGVILIASMVVLTYLGQLSRVYHYIRGEAMIKLYVLFNIIEILGKLCASIGQDAFDALYRTIRDMPWRVGRVMGHLVVALIYVVFHSLLMFVSLVSLNVAINSHGNALLTLLISNNFIELKGSVFKKFGPDNLLQICCRDAVERFHLFVFLGLIMLQDISSWDTLKEFAPTALLVFLAEVGVDWVKHSFVTKFNRLHADVYQAYCHIVVHDVLSSRRKIATSLDPTHVTSRRMGFSSIPLACLVLRLVMIKLQSERWAARPYTLAGFTVYLLAFAVLFALKVLVSMLLLVYAHYHGDGGLGPGSRNTTATPEMRKWAKVTRYALFNKRIPL